MSSAAKLTTALTGLAVAKNPHHTLGVLYGKIQRVLEKMPQDASYRKYTEQIINERSNILKSNKDVAAIEKQIACGQIEEVIVQAEKELQLARKMLAWQPWASKAKPAPATQWVWPPAK